MWGNHELADLDYDSIHYFVRAGERPQSDWDAVPAEIKNTFERLGIPEAERKFLAGVGAQYECLSGDARVYTTKGLVPIEEIQPGDTVFSFDEEANQIIPAEVRATARKGEREVFEVRVGTRTLKATSNHPFLALTYHKDEGRERGRYTRSWKYLHELVPGDLVAVAKDLPDTGVLHVLQQPEIKTQVTGRNQSTSYTLNIADRYNDVRLPEYTTAVLEETEVLVEVEFDGFVKIDSITPAGVEVVYDIEVDGPHNFVAEGLIVHNSEVVYHSLREEWQKMGVIFLDTDTALKEHPEIFKQYFGTVIPSADNKYAALNTAVWSGGSFVYVPAGVKVDIPLQAYFRINAESMGQFERTLIIIEEGAEAHYIEGCTAPIYSTNSLHSAVVEIIIKKGGKFRYTTIQNWANNIYNLVTKRAVAHEEASMEWVDGNIGSKLTMKYPSVYLMGRKARGEVLSVAYAGKGQHQDAGAKMVHVAPETTSRITNKSVSKDGGKTTYRGLAKVAPGAYGAKINVNCDALILDERSASDTIPYIEIEEDRCTLAHEATVGRIGAEQLFYLMSRGLPEADALSMIVLGFMEPFTRELPMEYAVELNRLIQMEMEGSVG
nr:Fe-S cluster assembly protein SufB [Oscillochloris trichoides]